MPLDGRTERDRISVTTGPDPWADLLVWLAAIGPLTPMVVEKGRRSRFTNTSAYGFVTVGMVAEVPCVMTTIGRGGSPLTAS